jgi:hypothetical protein
MSGGRCPPYVPCLMPRAPGCRYLRCVQMGGGRCQPDATGPASDKLATGIELQVGWASTTSCQFGAPYWTNVQLFLCRGRRVGTAHQLPYEKYSETRRARPHGGCPSGIAAASYWTKVQLFFQRAAG